MNNLNKIKLLIVEDDKELLYFVSRYLEEAGYIVIKCSDVNCAIEKIKTEKDISIVLLDLKLQDKNAIGLIPLITKINENILIIVITAYGDLDTITTAMRMGAYNFLKKPFDFKELDLALERAIDYLRKRELFEQLGKIIIGNSPQLSYIYQKIKVIAKTDCSILVSGESGVGKELVARTIHLMSVRSNAPFIAVNISAIPENLFESEFFGYVKGAFTGAYANKKGFFELANSGSIFLDEISEIPLYLQAKLLRVVEDKKIYPLGSENSINIDVRIISATHKNLEKEVADERFRDDLYYRLNVVEIILPPLRERKEDIPLLAGYILGKYVKKYNKDIKGFDDSSLEFIVNYDWPGNIRQLDNIIHRAVALCSGNYIKFEDLGLEKQIPYINPKGIDLEKEVENIEKLYIKQALKQTNNNIVKASKLLNIKERALRYKIEKYEIQRP